MSPIKNVIIVGAGGNIGPAILSAFLKDDRFNTTVLSRESSQSTFPDSVKVVQADYESVESLKKAFDGQDAVVSLVAGHVIGDQKKLIDAAIAAGVKRFLPSEYGSDTPNAELRKIVPVFEGKYETVNYLKSKESEISWSSVITGAFFDWGLKVGFLGFSVSDKIATLYDDGAATFSTTNLSTIGLAVTKVLEHAELTKNQYVYVSGYQATQKDILAAVEKSTGEKWTIKNVSTKDIIADGSAKLQKGDFSGIGQLIQGGLFGAERQFGDNSQRGLWNEKLGLRSDDLGTTVKAALQGKLVGET